MSDNSDDGEDGSEEEKIDFPEREIFVIPAREEFDVKEEPATGADEETVIEKKKPSVRMQRREYTRRAKKIVAGKPMSNTNYIKYLDQKTFLSPNFVQALQIVLVTVYGMYALMAFFIMIFYICDYKMALFDYTFIADAATIMIIFLTFTLFLSIIGTIANISIHSITNEFAPVAFTYKLLNF